MIQVKLFKNEEKLNDWLEKNDEYEIIDIKFQIATKIETSYLVIYKPRTL